MVQSEHFPLPALWSKARSHSGVIALLARGTLIKQKATAESCPRARPQAIASDREGEAGRHGRSRLIAVQGVRQLKPVFFYYLLSTFRFYPPPP